MNPVELFADLMGRSAKMMTNTLADFSEGEMLLRPVPEANHAAWQVGHLTVAESGMPNMVREGAVAALPPEFASKFTKEMCKNDDPNFFPKKAALMEQFGKTHAAVIAWANTLTPADLDYRITGRMADFVPTTGHLLALISSHIMMHSGQFQVIRRKLGKPILF